MRPKKYAAKDGSKITIRQATRADLPRFIANFQKVAREGIYVWTEQVSDEQKRGMARRLADRRSLMTVAEIDRGRNKEIVGSLTLATLGSAKKSRHVRNLGMSVIEGYREIGVGGALMDYALAWARKSRGVEKISLAVFSTNLRAITLYKEFGFEIEGVSKGAFVIGGKYVDEIHMGVFL